MSDIVRKNGQIIFKTQPSLSYILLTIFTGIGLIILPLLIILSLIRSLNTLEIFCNKVEPKLVDCQFTTVPKLGILPSSTETYKGIKGVEYLKETETKEDSEGRSYTVTYDYVIFNQIPGKNKVQFDERAQWVVSQINQFLNSDQETLKQTSSREPIAILFPVIFLSPFLIIFIRVGVFIVANVILYQSIDINNNLRQVVRTRIGIPFYSRKTLSFSDIKGLALIELIYEDSDKSYKLEIHINKNEKIDLWSVSKEEEANRLAREICRLTGWRLIEQQLKKRKQIGLLGRYAD